MKKNEKRRIYDELSEDLRKQTVQAIPMTSSRASGPLTTRLWLTIIVVAQIFITPFAAFSVNYLFQFDFGGENMSLSFHADMIPWIGIASLIYGMTALCLALFLGGFRPIMVVESGGWRSALGFSRNKRSALKRKESRGKFAASPHAKVSMLSYSRYSNGHSHISTHGSLVLLAIPFQILLATLPLSIVLLIPESVLHEHRRLELAMMLYIVCLLFTMKIFPYAARKYIAVASVTRKMIGAIAPLSLFLPVLLIWTMGHIANIVVLGTLGSSADLNIQFEQKLLENLLSVEHIPNSSFLDLLTALAVMPLSAFTTLAVLGGSSGEPPEWMNTAYAQSLQRQEPTRVAVALAKGAQIAATATASIATITAANVAMQSQIASTAASQTANATQLATSAQNIRTPIQFDSPSMKVADVIDKENVHLSNDDIQFEEALDLYDDIDTHDFINSIDEGDVHGTSSDLTIRGFENIEFD